GVRRAGALANLDEADEPDASEALRHGRLGELGIAADPNIGRLRQRRDRRPRWEDLIRGRAFRARGTDQQDDDETPGNAHLLNSNEDGPLADQPPAARTRAWASALLGSSASARRPLARAASRSPWRNAIFPSATRSLALSLTETARSSSRRAAAGSVVCDAALAARASYAGS